MNFVTSPVSCTVLFMVAFVLLRPALGQVEHPVRVAAFKADRVGASAEQLIDSIGNGNKLVDRRISPDEICKSLLRKIAAWNNPNRNGWSVKSMSHCGSMSLANTLANALG